MFDWDLGLSDAASSAVRFVSVTQTTVAAFSGVLRATPDGT